MSQLPDEPQVSAATSAAPPATAGSGGFTAPEAPHAGSGLAASGAYASRWARLGAAILDGLIIVIPSAIVGVITGSMAAYYVVALIVSLLYGPILLARTGEHNGQTLAKQALNIRVVREDGQPLTFGTGALREIVGKSLLSGITFGLYSLIDSLWCLWDAKRQCLHDKIASTVVTRA